MCSTAPDARHREVQLEVALVVPRERAHAVALLARPSRRSARASRSTRSATSAKLRALDHARLGAA